MQIVRILAGAALLAVITPVQAESPSEACGLPERRVAQYEIRPAQEKSSDPVFYTGGWGSIRRTGPDRFAIWGWGTESGNTSVREYNATTDSWTIVKPQVGNGHFDKDTDSYDAAARETYCPENPSDCRIKTAYDNHLHFHIPDTDELITIGTAYRGHWGGVFNFEAGRWSVVWKDAADAGQSNWLKPLSFEVNTWPWNAPHTWIDPDGAGGRPGVGFAYGGRIQGNDADWMWILAPADGPYRWQWKRKRSQPPGPIAQNRNGAIAAGSCAYIFGGSRNGQPSRAVWRYNVTTESWKRMADMPAASAWNAASYDPRLNLAVVVAGSDDRVLVYNLEEDRWQDVSERANLPNVSQPAAAYANGRHYIMGRGWDRNGDGKFSTRTRDDLWSITLTAARYDPPNYELRKQPGDLGKAPQPPLKHIEWEWDPGTKRYWTAGGDWQSPGGHGNSASQEIYSYDPAADEWHLEKPYCVGPDGLTWYHPDEVGLEYDANREKLWFIPGEQWVPEQACQDGGTYVRGKVMLLDPHTANFTVPHQEEKPRVAGAPQLKGAYDPETDKIYQFGDWHVLIFNPGSGTWQKIYHNGDLPRRKGGFGSVDLSESEPVRIGRWLYVVDTKQDRLFRWNIDRARHLELVSRLPAPYARDLSRIGPYLVFFPTWHWQRPRPIGLFNTVTQSWAEIPYPDWGVEIGASAAVSAERHELFVHGSFENAQPAEQIGLIDLSFLPGGSVRN